MEEKKKGILAILICAGIGFIVSTIFVVGLLLPSILNKNPDIIYHTMENEVIMSTLILGTIFGALYGPILRSEMIDDENHENNQTILPEGNQEMIDNY